MPLATPAGALHAGAEALNYAGQIDDAASVATGDYDTSLSVIGGSSQFASQVADWEEVFIGHAPALGYESGHQQMDHDPLPLEDEEADEASSLYGHGNEDDAQTTYAKAI